MLHERTAALVHLDAVAVRNQSDTLVWYADRLTTPQRAALRRYLLEALADKKGPVATVAVAAGATQLVLAGTKARTQGVAPLSLAGTVLFTLAASLVTAVFVAAVVVLIVEAQLGHGSRPLMAAEGRQEAVGSESTGILRAESPAAVPELDEPPSGGSARSPLGDLPAAGPVQQAAPPSPPPYGPVTSPGSSPAGPAPSAPAAPVVQKPPAPSGEDPGRPDVDLPNVNLPDVDPPAIGIPDTGVSVDLPKVELPAVELPDVDLPEPSDVDLSAVPDLSDVDLPDVDRSNEEEAGSDRGDAEEVDDAGDVDDDDVGGSEPAEDPESR
jgi:hypothetical protein